MKSQNLNLNYDNKRNIIYDILNIVSHTQAASTQKQFKIIGKNNKSADYNNIMNYTVGPTDIVIASFVFTLAKRMN